MAAAARAQACATKDHLAPLLHRGRLGLGRGGLRRPRASARLGAAAERGAAPPARITHLRGGAPAHR